VIVCFFFFFQAEDGIRDFHVTGVQTCALPILPRNENMESVQAIKQRFEIIGNDPKLNRAVEKAIQVAPTDISVLVTGESGVGKRSEERRVGKECRARRRQDDRKKKKGIA